MLCNCMRTSGCPKTCLIRTVQDASHRVVETNTLRGHVVGGGGSGAFVAPLSRNIPAAAVLADEGAVLVELDVDTVTVLRQAVLAPQLAPHTQRGLAHRTLLVIVTVREETEREREGGKRGGGE